MFELIAKTVDGKPSGTHCQTRKTRIQGRTRTAIGVHPVRGDLVRGRIDAPDVALVVPGYVRVGREGVSAGLRGGPRVGCYVAISTGRRRDMRERWLRTVLGATNVHVVARADTHAGDGVCVP